MSTQRIAPCEKRLQDLKVYTDKQIQAKDASEGYATFREAVQLGRRNYPIPDLQVKVTDCAPLGDDVLLARKVPLYDKHAPIKFTIYVSLAFLSKAEKSEIVHEALAQVCFAHVRKDQRTKLTSQDELVALLVRSHICAADLVGDEVRAEWFRRFQKMQ